MAGNTIVDTFRQLNQTKVERLSSLLPAKRQALLEFIPLLFQANAESLPAFVDKNVPVGIVDYRPSPDAIGTAKTYQHSYQYRHSALRNYPIRALYLIKKTGLFYYQASEQLALQIIHIDSLEAEQLQLLQQKADAIEHWLNSQGLTIKLDLIDETQLTKTEDNFAINDFYCCGILLAGAMPTWTMVEENNQLSTLTNQQLKLAIQLPALSQPSARSLFDYAIEQFNIAMTRRLDACLDLIYISCLLKQYPQQTWLSDLIKPLIAEQEEEEHDLLQFDVNSLKLQFITQQLDDADQIELARQALYVISRESISKDTKQATFPWRRQFIKQQVNDWQWDKETIDKLNPQFLNQYRPRLAHFEIVRDQLTNTLKQLAAFAKAHKFDSKPVEQCQKQLKQLFFDQADCLSCLPVTFLPDSEADQIFIQRNQQNLWTLNDQNNAIAKPLYQHQSIVNLLAWATINRLNSASTMIKVTDQQHNVEVKTMLELAQYLRRTMLETSKVGGKAPTSIQQLLLFANIDHQTTDALSQKGLQVTTLQDDPLNYAGKKQNLVAKMAGLVKIDAQQWQFIEASGKDSVLQLLSSLLHWPANKLSNINVSCWSGFENLSQKINTRLKNLITDVNAHYQNSADNGNYLVPLGGKLAELHWQDGLCDSRILSAKINSASWLSQPRKHFTATAVDSLLDPSKLYATLLNNQAKDSINLFISQKKEQATVYIIDELGALTSYNYNGLNLNTIVNHFHAFLQNCCDCRLQFFQLTIDKSRYRSTAIKLDATAAKSTYLPLVITLDSLADDAQCDIQCGNKTFSGSANKSDTYNQVRALVLSLRKGKQSYPLYISKLSFKQKNITTQQHLTRKKQLELLLNKLIG